MNSRFSLAVHILCLLAASEPGQRLTSEFIAASIGTNPVVIRRLLARLRRHGLVTSKSAGGGGWMLAQPANEITLDCVRQAATEGETAKIHRNAPHPACPVGKGVRAALVDLYNDADAALDKHLSQTTLAGFLATTLREHVKAPAPAS